MLSHNVSYTIIPNVIQPWNSCLDRVLYYSPSSAYTCINSTFVWWSQNAYVNTAFVHAQKVSTSFAFLVLQYLSTTEMCGDTPLEFFYTFGSYCISLQEVASRWQSRDTASFGNDGESRESSSKKGQSCPCHVRVSTVYSITRVWCCWKWVWKWSSWRLAC